MDPGHEAADPCLRSYGLPGRAGRVDRREISQLERRPIGRDDLLADAWLLLVQRRDRLVFLGVLRRMHQGWPIPAGKTIDVRMGYAGFPKEFLRPPRSAPRRRRPFTPVEHWTSMKKGRRPRRPPSRHRRGLTKR